MIVKTHSGTVYNFTFRRSADIYCFEQYPDYDPWGSENEYTDANISGVRITFEKQSIMIAPGSVFQDTRDGEQITLSWCKDECKELWKHLFIGAYGYDNLEKVMGFMNDNNIEKIITVVTAEK